MTDTATVCTATASDVDGDEEVELDAGAPHRARARAWVPPAPRRQLQTRAARWSAEVLRIDRAMDEHDTRFVNELETLVGVARAVVERVQERQAGRRGGDGGVAPYRYEIEMRYEMLEHDMQNDEPQVRVHDA